MPDYRMKAESGEFRLTGQDARLIHTIISRVVKKNWWLIGLYATITVGGVFGASHVSDRPSHDASGDHDHKRSSLT